MKKLTSLLLTVCMCLSVGVMLTACGQTKDESYTVKTTVTSDEWKAMFTPTNVTINGSYDEGGEETVTIKAADGKWMYIVVESDETFGEYYLRENDAWYVASYENGEWDEEPHIAKWLSDKGEALTLGDVWERFDGYENMFEQFSYDENLKAYVQVQEKGYYDSSLNSSVDREIVVYVEDGKLKKIEYYTDMERQTVESNFLFVNYGTTVINETAE